MSLSVMQTLLYVLVCALYVCAAYQIRGIVGFRPPRRQRMLEEIKYRNLRLRQFMVPELLQTRFRQAGYPFGLTAQRFQLIRFGIGLPAAAAGVYLFFHSPQTGAFNRLLLIVGPLLFLFVLSHPDRSLMKTLFRVHGDRSNDGKNREMFMLYSMIVDEMRQGAGRTINVLDLLSKLAVYAPRIRGAIQKGLRNARLPVDVVMNIIGEEIGTEEAVAVCKIVAQLNQAGEDGLHELIANREQAFIATLRANRVKRRTRQTNLIQILVWLPLVFYIFDILFVVFQMIAAMTLNVTQLGT